MSRKYDILTLIELVETRPCLWDKTGEEFKDREFKSKLWLEVYTFLEPDFQQLDRKEQIKVGRYYKLLFIMFEKYFIRTVNPDICRLVFTPFRTEIYV
jgi:hypothetical protein